MLFVTAAALLVAACDGKVRSEFVAGCMNQGAPELKCDCLYDKLKDKYGVDGLKDMQHGETMPPGFVEASVVGAAQCSGVDPQVAMKQLGLTGDDNRAPSGPDVSPKPGIPRAEGGDASSLQSQESDEMAISEVITITAGANARDEHRDARKVAMGDLNDDGANDAAAVFTIEDAAQSTSTQFLSAFIRQADGALKFVSTTPVGGMGSAIDGVSIENGAIRLKTLTPGPDDADCCPSVEGKVDFLLHNGKLKRVE